MKAQIFKTPKGEEMVILPKADFDRMAASFEEAEDIKSAQEILARVEHGDEDVFPGDLVFAISNGENPVKAFREFRGLTAEKVSKAAGISRAYLTQIETGQREGKASTLAAIAKALQVDVGLLIQA